MRETASSLEGILLIDKPPDFTSFDVVAKLRGITKTRRIGHAGTLDPMATGVLPVFFGRATKACDVLPRQDKRYSAEFRLGITTDTLDITGRRTGEFHVSATPEKVVETAARFVGDSLQIPPMYSAVKINGRRLYDLARRGIEVDRRARPITIHSLHCAALSGQENTYTLDVHCSKGVYIRTLISDIGEMLGCGAVMTRLRRTHVGGFCIDDCMSLERVGELMKAGELESALLPVAGAFSGLDRAYLSPVQTRMLLNGVKLDASRVRHSGREPFAVYYNDEFIGLAKIDERDFILTKRFVLEVKDACR